MTYTIGWIAWIAFFLIEESIALLCGTWRDTLSGHVWTWFSVKEKGRAWRIRRAVLAGFMAWLIIHFVSGGVLM